MKEVEIKWCPTKKMVTDFMTKPLQGSHFRRLWDLIMGMASIKKAKNPSTSKSSVIKRKTLSRLGCSKETRQLGSRLVLLVSR